LKTGQDPDYSTLPWIARGALYLILFVTAAIVVMLFVVWLSYQGTAA
jgi:hypothetical protein